jgi:hypothetical protein
LALSLSFVESLVPDLRKESMAVHTVCAFVLNARVPQPTQKFCGAGQDADLAGELPEAPEMALFPSDKTKKTPDPNPRIFA